MKKILTILLGLSFVLPALAQQEPTGLFEAKEGILLDGQTIVKTSVTSLLSESYSFAVERTNRVARRSPSLRR